MPGVAAESRANRLDFKGVTGEPYQRTEPKLELKESSIRFGADPNGWGTTNKSHFSSFAEDRMPKKSFGATAGPTGFHRQGLLFKGRGEVLAEPETQVVSPTFAASVNLGMDKNSFDSISNSAFRASQVPENERAMDMRIHSFMKGKYVTLGSQAGASESTSKGAFCAHGPTGATTDMLNSNFRKSIHFGKGKEEGGASGTCYARMFPRQSPQLKEVLQNSVLNKERKRELLKHDTQLGYHAETSASLAMDSYGKKEAESNERARLEFQRRIERQNFNIFQGKTLDVALKPDGPRSLAVSPRYQKDIADNWRTHIPYAIQGKKESSASYSASRSPAI